jgi:hypothetical protein
MPSVIDWEPPAIPLANALAQGTEDFHILRAIRNASSFVTAVSQWIAHEGITALD